MASIEVDIDQFSDEDILQELKERITERRWKTNVQRLALREKIKNLLNIDIQHQRTYTLNDTMKVDLFLENINKIKLEDIEKLIA